MKKLFLTLGLIGLIFVGVLAVPIFIGHFQNRAAEPPPEVESFQTFRTCMDDGSYEYFVFGISDKRFYEARKLLPFYFTFRSGWACYVFDTSGQYLGWTEDNGDDPPWNLKWGQLGRSPIAVEDIEVAIRAATQKPSPNRVPATD